MEIELEIEIATGADDGGASVNSGNFATSSTSIFVGDYTKYEGLTNSYLLFKNVALPQFAEIINANLIVNNISSTVNSAVTFNIYGEDVGDATAPISNADLDGRTTTTATVLIEVSSGSSQDNETLADITSILTEITSRNDWVSGNDILILLKANAGGDGYYQFASFENTTKDPAKLVITYDAQYYPGNTEITNLPTNSTTLTNRTL